MKLSMSGADALIQREEEVLRAYQDSAGVWTIGVGHVASWVKEGVEITVERSRELFTADVAWAENSVNENVSVSLNQDQFDSLVSFVFNVGPNAFRSSTLVRELNKGNYDAVPHQMMRWNKATVDGVKMVIRGLTNRRISEVKQWNLGLREESKSTIRPNKPEGRSASDVAKTSKTVRSGAAVGLLGAVGGATEMMNTVSDAADATSGLFTNGLIIGCVLLVGIGGYIIYNRIKDSKEGRAY